MFEWKDFPQIGWSCFKRTSKGQEVAESISEKVELSLKQQFEVLAATLSLTIDFMEKLTQLQSQNNDKSSKLFKKSLKSIKLWY